MYRWNFSPPFCGRVFTMALSSAVQQHVLVVFWCNLICPFLLLCCELSDCPNQKVIACAYVYNYFSLSSSASSFKQKPRSMLSWLVYRAKDGNMAPFFHLQIYQIFQHSVLKKLSFSNGWSGNPCGCSCVGLFLGVLF